MVIQRRIRIASRGSELALWQAENVRGQLIESHPGLIVQIDVIRTTGDRILDVPLAKIGDRGLFTKEIDQALLDGRADLAVHSLKDVPTRLPNGLDLAAIGRRADPRDVLITRRGQPTSLTKLQASARVGTSSLRRRSQLKQLRPDLEVVDLRGNLNTRLAKLDRGEYEAIILAAAGVERLGWSNRIAQYLNPNDWLPAVGQGALAIVSRAEDPDVRSLLDPLHDEETEVCVRAERAFLRALEGGCQVPIAALATVDGEALELDGLVSNLEGDLVLRERLIASRDEPETLGNKLAESLVYLGADDLLRSIRADDPVPGISGP